MSFDFETVLILFSLVLVVGLITRELYPLNAKAAVTIGLLLLIWLGAVLLLAGGNVFNPLRSSPIPVGVGVLLPIFLGAIAIHRIPKFKNLLFSVSQRSLILIHMNRIIGAIFLWYYMQNRLPGIFTFSAALGDCLVAASAPFVVWIIRREKPYAETVFRIFHYVGILDFVAAVTLGALSSEGPQRLIFQNVPANAISSLPLVLIPTFGVPVIALAHWISLLKFYEARKNKSRRTNSDLNLTL